MISFFFKYNYHLSRILIKKGMALKTENNNKEQSKSVSDNLAKKIVIRRLPPSMTKEQFLEIISPMPEYDYFYYCHADMR